MASPDTGDEQMKTKTGFFSGGHHQAFNDCTAAARLLLILRFSQMFFFFLKDHPTNRKRTAVFYFAVHG